jgi:hypothetical protein
LIVRRNNQATADLPNEFFLLAALFSAHCFSFGEAAIAHYPAIE